MGTNLTEEITQTYAKRDLAKGNRYAWWQPDVMNQGIQRTTLVKKLLHRTIGADLGDRTILDIGCGDGALLRLFIECGADPGRIRGIDILPDRIAEGRMKSPSAMRMDVGNILEMELDDRFDLVTAFTVLSSITDPHLRGRMVQRLWERVRPGGWLMCFDFRFNNPRNPDVRRVTREDFKAIESQGGGTVIRKTLLTAPPLARRLCRISPRLDTMVSSLFPFLRSHQIIMVGRGAD